MTVQTATPEARDAASPRDRPSGASQRFDEAQRAHWGRTTNVRRYDHPVVELFARQRVGAIRQLLGPWRPTNSLDVGCGDGFGMLHMKGVVDHLWGCDRSPRMLAANPASPVRLSECDAYALPYAAAQFDLVYCWELLHHVGEPQRVVREMTRVSRGAVLLCEPNCLNPAMAAFGLIASAERGLLRFTPGYTRRLLVDAGLERVECITTSWFTPNRTPLWLARALSRLPYRIPRIGLYSLAIGFKPPL